MPPPQTDTGWILFDGSCGVCATWVPLWRGTLIRLGLGTAALQEPWVQEQTRIPPEHLLDDLTLLLVDGSVIRGAQVYRWCLRRLWWGWPLWLLSVLPVGRQGFDLGYRTFARNRYRVSQVCRLKPTQGKH